MWDAPEQEEKQKKEKVNFKEYLPYVFTAGLSLLAGAVIGGMFLGKEQVEVKTDTVLAKKQLMEVQKYISEMQKKNLEEIRELRKEIREVRKEIESVKKKERETPEKPLKKVLEEKKKTKREEYSPVYLQGKRSFVVMPPEGKEGEYEPLFGSPPKLVTVKKEEKEEVKKKLGSSPEKEEKKVYIPPTTLMKGTILHSFVAPVLSAGDAIPAPVLIKIEGIARLPNGKSVNLDGCTVLAKAEGTWIGERAKLQTKKIVCVLENGKVVEGDLNGYVVSGKDNVEGVKGKFINVNSKQIMTYFAATGMGGFFSALQRSLEEERTSVLGTYVRIKDKFLYSTYGAFAQTFQEFARFYLERAKKIVPVVVVSAPKPVFITVIDGFTLNVSPEEFAKYF